MPRTTTISHILGRRSDAFRPATTISDMRATRWLGRAAGVLLLWLLVFAASASAAEVRFGDGGWSWFQDPRAVTYTGDQTRTYVGWVTPAGDVTVGSYDHGHVPCRCHPADVGARLVAGVGDGTRVLEPGPTSVAEAHLRRGCGRGEHQQPEQEHPGRTPQPPRRPHVRDGSRGPEGIRPPSQNVGDGGRPRHRSRHRPHRLRRGALARAHAGGAGRWCDRHRLR